MSLGAILVGIAVTMIVIAYAARPFRRTTTDHDAVIESWVAQLTPPTHTPTPPPPHSPTPPLPHSQTNFCPQCGRRVQPDHRFCPGCGYRLPVEEAEA